MSAANAVTEELMREMAKQAALGHKQFCVGVHEMDGHAPQAEWVEWTEAFADLAAALAASPTAQPECSVCGPLLHTSPVCSAAPHIVHTAQPDGEPSTEWLIERREHARAQIARWAQATEDMQGDPVQQMRYWRGFDDALGYVMARRVNLRAARSLAGERTASGDASEVTP